MKIHLGRPAPIFSDELTACGVERGRDLSRYKISKTDKVESVTCGKCKRTEIFKALRK